MDKSTISERNALRCGAGCVERAVDTTGTEEVAVMVDAFGRLGFSEEARRVVDCDYPFSWARNG
jgi:hypothetical protein